MIFVKPIRLAAAAVVCSVLLALPVLLIRAQAYDGGFLSDFLLPPADCPAPCLLGVRPGSTSVDRALAVLRANPAIAQVQVDYYYAGQSIFWRWLQDPVGSYRQYAFRADRRNLITRFVLPSDIRLGDVLLILGTPARVTAAWMNEYLPRAAVVLDYPAYGLYVWIGLYPCTLDQRDFWQMRHESSAYGTFVIGLDRASYARIQPETRVELDPRAWGKQLRDFCRAT
jgi:hypothetical protein